MPRVEVVATARDYGRFAIGPLEPGFGLILGNALRRILLSSLPGAAITSVRIEGVYHEFSTLPHVKEDVTEIILNIKKIRLRSYSDRPVRMQLSYQGPGLARASDIQVPSQVELVNPDQGLATVDSTEGRLEFEFTVERGRGYLSSDLREGLPIGTIPVDAIFTPIPQVNYLTEPMSEGDRTDLDRLVLEIWTDGTIDAGEALSLAAQAFSQHSALLANYSSPSAAGPERLVAVSTIPSHVAEMPIEDLNLSVRTFNCLKRSGITRVGQVIQMDRKALLSVRNFGLKSFEELQDALIRRELIEPGHFGSAPLSETELAVAVDAEDELYLESITDEYDELPIVDVTQTYTFDPNDETNES
jgi:DNA-directed RNA polymerase subunit alpha